MAFNISRDYVIYLTGNRTIAEEVASLVAGEFIVKGVSGEEKGVRSWIFTTAKNKCSEHLRRKNKEFNLTKEARDKLYFENMIKDAERDSNLHKAFKEAKNNLSEQYIVTLDLIKKYNYDYAVISGILNISESTARKRKSRLFKELGANTKLYMGLQGTRAIETPKINSRLYNFLRSFKKNLENNTLHKMNRYFGMQHLQDFQANIKISEIDNYEMQLIDNEYTVLVAYLNINSKFEVFDFRFRIDNHQLKVTKSPKKKKIEAEIKKDSPLALEFNKLMKLYPPERTGKSTIPDELIHKLVAKYNKEKSQNIAPS